jgi:uncharacterized protein (DUF2147 family)
MKLLKHTLLLLCASLAIVGASARAEQASPEAGRWITESGNLEVEIAACGQAYCGTIVRVLANNSMNNPAAAMAPAAGAASPIGKKIMFDLQPMEGGGWQGHIYNREDNKTYNSRLTALGTDQLRLSIYADNPEQAKVQVWRRPAPPVAQASK